MNKNNFNTSQSSRKKESPTNGWFFWSYEDVIPVFLEFLQDPNLNQRTPLLNAVWKLKN